MKVEKSNDKRKYKPVKIRDSLKSLNQNFLYKYGKTNFMIHSKWFEIVGSYFFEHTKPKKITSIPLTKDDSGNQLYENILVVDVLPAAVIEFQYFQNKIIEKINSYMGYKSIDSIKIHQIKFNNKRNSSSNMPMKEHTLNKNLKKIKNTTSEINDKELKKSLIKLGISLERKK